MKIDGVILAGGASARMGEHKPLLPFRGATLIEAVIARAKPQVTELAIDVSPAMAEAYRARLRENVLPDRYGEQLGPLCGIITGLAWCESEWLAAFPCDTPFLPRDLVAQLAAHARGAPAVARGAQVCGLWPKSCVSDLKRGFESAALHSVLSAVEALGGSVVKIVADDRAFFNVNTPEDLAAAESFSPSP
jgi:molybdopterin-guanine dinucleotide biosynthesis protein A